LISSIALAWQLPSRMKRGPARGQHKSQTLATGCGLSRYAKEARLGELGRNTYVGDEVPSYKPIAVSNLAFEIIEQWQ
jgi:hypothetical protein